jgi:hypothetical protein
MELSAEAWTFMPDPEQGCPACGHTVGPHLFFATDRSSSDRLPAAGGVLVCPVDGCVCGRPVGTATAPCAYMPGQEDLIGVHHFMQRSDRPTDGGSVATLALWTDDPDPLVVTARDRLREQTEG